MWEWISSFLKLFEDVWLLIGAVSRGTTFPKQLSAHEEAECLKKLAEGDRNARNLLIEHNLRLVAYIARKYVSPGRSMDDLVSIGTIGLIKAVDTYNPERAKNLAGYLARCIENEILMSIRSQKKQRREVSLQDSVGMDKDGNELALMELLDSGEEDLADRLDRSLRSDSVRAALNSSLEPREKEIIIARYGLNGNEPATQKEVASQQHISRSYVSGREYEKSSSREL